MATTITFPTVNHVDDASATASMKTNWADGWTVYPKLHCRRLTLASGPGISTATFHWRIGDNLWPGTTGWTSNGVLSVNQRAYVRVVVAGSGGRAGYTWYGVWKGARLQTDRQTFEANGLESLLDVPCLDAAYVDSVAPSSPGAPTYTKLGLTFNENGKPNRSHARFTINGAACYIFSNDPNGGYWSTRDIVEYLLAMGAPLNAGGTAIFAWTLNGLSNLPSFDQPVLPSHGRTYLSLLNSIVTRFRLTGWKCNGTIISFYTFADSAINLTNNIGQTIGTIPANNSQIVVDISQDQSANATLATEASHVCDAVRVDGERRKSVYSLRADIDGTLVKKWTAAQELEYIDGASNEADYPPAAELRLREERNRDARTCDNLLPVYSWFGVDDEWNQKAGDCEGGLDLLPVAIVDAPDEQFWIYPGELKFLPDLPLLTGHTYADDVIANHQTGRTIGHRGNATGDPPYEPLPPIAIIRTLSTTQDYWGLEQWMPIDQLGDIADLEPTMGMYRDMEHGDTADRKWSASVRIVRDQPVIEIRVQGEVQHAIARDEFFGRPLENVTGALDWKDIIVTVCSYDTRQVSVTYPATVSPLGEYVETLRIEAPGHELIYVVPGTIVSTDPLTRTLQKSTGGYLQDDRDQMQIIAQRAYEWHRVPRYTLGFGSGYVDGQVQIGQLVTSYTDATGLFPVGSVLTEITIDFPVSESDTPARPGASYVTAFGELDPVKVV